MRHLITLIICVFIIVPALYADTIIMKDKTKLKGLVVDEYSDRITLSTVDGEKNIFRKDIDRIEYDTPEQNLMQLGRSYESKGWHDKAAFYYKKAMELNPGYKEARESYLACHAKVWRQEERMAKKELERTAMAMDWWKNKNNKTKPATKNKTVLLNSTLGMSLAKEGDIFRITDVRSYSSADKAGMRKGDILAGIWHKLIRYKDTDEVVDELLGPRYSEVKVLLERDVVIPTESNYDDLLKEIGIALGVEYEGLIIKDIVEGKIGGALGLKKGDYVLAIDKNITRYLSLDSVIALINSAKNNKEIVFTIRRDVNLRREGEL
ncbi:MAG: tetratricopeptide repeat protein [Candidatus Omnitrophota bacterium]